MNKGTRRVISRVIQSFRLYFLVEIANFFTVCFVLNSKTWSIVRRTLRSWRIKFGNYFRVLLSGIKSISECPRFTKGCYVGPRRRVPSNLDNYSNSGTRTTVAVSSFAHSLGGVTLPLSESIRLDEDQPDSFSRSASSSRGVGWSFNYTWNSTSFN